MPTNFDEDQQCYWLIFVNEKLFIRNHDNNLLKAQFCQLTFIHAYTDDIELIGQYQGLPCLMVDMQSEQVTIEGWQQLSMRQFLMLFSQQSLDFSIVAKAWQYALFKRTHRFCGRCGAHMQQVGWEMAMQCYQCQHRCYPRISPCVIVLIRKGRQILLAQGESQRNRKMHSLIAGFVESGESLEQAAHREVKEEVGIEINNLCYFSSQPWPFPHSLMVGFFADHAAGDIQVDGEEILNADWFDMDNLPTVPSKVSIAGQMIEHLANLESGSQSI